LKEENNRIEEVKQKKETNLTKLDEKATLLNLKKEGENEKDKDKGDNKSISTTPSQDVGIQNTNTSLGSTPLALPSNTNGPNGTILLPDSMK